MGTAVRLPHWDMSTIYPALDSPEFDRAFDQVISDIGALADLFNRWDIGDGSDSGVTATNVHAFEEAISALNALLEPAHVVSAYISSFVATDSRNDLAQARWSELQQHFVTLSQLETRFTAWIGHLDVETLIERSPLAADHSFLLRKEHEAARHLMSPAEEDLAAALSVSGATAWSKLHPNLTSQLMVSIELDDGRHDLPMSAVRNLALDPVREIRQSAYVAELEAWKGAGVPLAAALNSIKGYNNTLDERRGWDSALDVALFNNNIDRPTLDAMMEAARDSFVDFRRYLKVKAGALGIPVLAWYDLFAPLGRSTQTWEWDAAADFISEQFGTYSGRLRQFAVRAFAERWIDAEPRPGKRDGAFCMRIRGGDSRILANFTPSYDGMSTIAHELGHGYHNLNLADRTALQRSTPMVLAETASIFCQTIVKNAALARATRDEQIAILEASLQDDCQVVVDISSRFLFERAVFEQRRRRELSVDELNGLMLDAQRQTYGDGLDPNYLHPYMWAVKGHYYGPARPFYNFPYMFGLLFGLGLYARYERDPEQFRAGYDDLLSATGLADAATLAGRFGIDIRTSEFWHASLDMIRRDIDRLQTLIA